MLGPDSNGWQVRLGHCQMIRTGGHPYDEVRAEGVDLVAAGVIDPAMVTRSALQNAASIAKNILTTEAIVAEVPEKDGGNGGHGGGMPDMGGMM